MIRWFLFFFAVSSTAFGQQTVEGKVVDRETGLPISYASIVVVRTSAGTTTNLEGQFSLSIPDTASIKVTCIGYETQVVKSFMGMRLIQLKPIFIQLAEVYVYNKAVNPKKVVRKAFSTISKNYDEKPFLQKFFYRHYSKNDSEYEKLIEASIDVWKDGGYRTTRRSVGEREEIRVAHLRRSLDIKGMVQGQTPISLAHILQTDIVGYQASQSEQPNFFEQASSLKTDFRNYIFSFDGITNYDGQEVYKINYKHKKDSVTTAVNKNYPEVTGTLFITTDTYAFVKTEDAISNEINTVQTSVYYRKYNGKYYPYHFIREGENHFFDRTTHSFHLELMSVEIRNGDSEKFAGQVMGREELLKIPYDSLYWNNATILKTTPLEDDIIHGLGGGVSLNKQFFLYKQYELNVTNGGENGEKKFSWLREDSKGKRILYICFWNSDFKSYLVDMEYFKQLNLLYKNKITFVLISLENDETKWQQLVTRYNYFSDGIINYRVGETSELAKFYKIKKVPSFILLSKDGSAFDLNAKHPSDPLLENDFKFLIEQE